MQDNNNDAGLSVTVCSVAKRTGEVHEFYFDTYDKANDVFIKLQAAMEEGTKGQRIADDYGQSAVFHPESLGSVAIMDYGRRFKAHEAIQVIKQRAEQALQRRIMGDPVLNFMKANPPQPPITGMVP